MQAKVRARSRLAAAKNRTGFSLVEVLLVIAIASLLSASLLQMLQQFGWVTNRSRNQVSGAIIARSVFDEMRHVLRGVVRAGHQDRQPRPSDSLTGDLSDTAALETDNGALETKLGKTDGETRNPSGGSVPATAGLIGGERSMAILTVASDLPGRHWVVFSTTRQNVCELQALAGSATSTYPMAGRFADNTLIKLAVPKTACERIEDLLWVEDVHETELQDGVTEIAFRYYDGLDWHDTWDSRVAEKLPTAVSIHLSLAEPIGGGDGRSAPPASDVFRTIIELTER